MNKLAFQQHLAFSVVGMGSCGHPKPCVLRVTHTLIRDVWKLPSNFVIYLEKGFSGCWKTPRYLHNREATAPRCHCVCMPIFSPGRKACAVSHGSFEIGYRLKSLL